MTIALEEKVQKLPQAERDTPWKHVTNTYFQEFLTFCFPNIAMQIDWDTGYELLDKEFLKLFKRAQVGVRHGDRLLKLRLKSEDPVFILGHTEIQGDYDPHFNKRMLTYNYRGIDAYDLPVFCIALLLDDDPNWRPSGCKIGYAGSFIEVHYHTVKALDYLPRKTELEQMDNPFVIMLLAQLHTIESKKDPTLRMHLKVDLIRKLYQKDMKETDIRNLLSLIDWTMALPDYLMAEYLNTIKSIEEEINMTYISSAERFGFQQGIQQGIRQGHEKGAQNTFMLLLTRRFGEVPQKYQDLIAKADEEQIEIWIGRVLAVDTLAEIFKKS